MPDKLPARRLCVFLLQMGGPKSNTDIEPFLYNLFADILPVPNFAKKTLAAFIARRRAPKVASLYSMIGGGSPIATNTAAQALALEQKLNEQGFTARVLVVMRYSSPRLSEALAIARRDWSSATWVALPLYPQYSLATTHSSIGELLAQLTVAERARLRVIEAYPTHPGYIDAVATCVCAAFNAIPLARQNETHLVFSAHGLPLKLVRRGDPYPKQVAQTVNAVVLRLKLNNPVHLCFQSRVGPIRWLKPSTPETIISLGKKGVRSVVVVPISFVSEHLETLHELDIALRHVALNAGIIDFCRAATPAINPDFITALASLIIMNEEVTKTC